MVKTNILGFPSSLTQAIIEDKSLIIYRPKLNQITGSVLSTILLHQIIYWAYKSDNLFYKFKEPCNHELYKIGDSWTEELGFTRWEFESALSKIAKKYNPKKEDPPADSFIVFYTDIRRLTWYSVNWYKLNSAIEKAFIRKEEIPLYVKRDSNFTYSDNSSLQYIDTEITTNRIQQTSLPESIDKPLPEKTNINNDAVAFLGKYGIPYDNACRISEKFSLPFIERKIKEIELKFVKGNINNLQGYIITVFDKTESEESLYEKEQKAKAELSKKQIKEAEILANKKAQKEEREHIEYINITNKLIAESNVVEQRWFSEWLKNENIVVYNIHKEKGLKSLMVETYFRRYLYNKYFKTDPGE